jgi:hypothetical protein
MNIKLPRRKKPEEPKKPKFNFNTNRKAVKEAKRYVPELDGKTREQLVHAWKILHSRKKLSAEDKQMFEDIKMYLKTKFSIGV